VLALPLVETEFPFLIASHLPRWIELTSSAGPRTAFLASIFSREASTRRESTLGASMDLHRGSDEQIFGAK
jgi:hypothetical protein